MEILDKVELKIIEKNSEHIEMIKEIYLYSFPDNERIDFDEILNHTFPNSQLLGFFCDKNLIGFSVVSVHKKFVYIAYLAIDKNQRGKGLGSQAAKEICKFYNDKTIVLSVEKPEKQADKQNRVINFYKKNGFELMDFEFCWSGQVFWPMHYREYEKQEFIECLLVCFPTCHDFKDRI